MGRKPSDPRTSGTSSTIWIILMCAFISCYLIYMVVFAPPPSLGSLSSSIAALNAGEEEAECCRGVEGLELWGSAVKWGTDHKFNNSRDCCLACRNMCEGMDGPCLCDSWVFCGDRERCGDKFGECWLKKQKDVMFPDVKESGEKVIWTSGLIFGTGEGIIGLETDHGVLHIKLLPEFAPRSVAYIVELLGSRHCAGCHFFRAEGRGNSWDSNGNHIEDASFGPPHALVQGTLKAEGVNYKNIPTEACSSIIRGSVAWVGSGPEFFISLANHDDWGRAYTVFGYVLPDDMEIVEKITLLPTRTDVWGETTVSVLQKPVQLRVKRITERLGDLNLNQKTNPGSK